MTRSNYLEDSAGNISIQNVGSTGVSQKLMYNTLIVSIILLLVIGLIPGLDNIYSIIGSRLMLITTIILVITTYIQTITTEKANNMATLGQSFNIVDRCKGSFISILYFNGPACPKLINSFYFSFQKDPLTQLPEIVPDNVVTVEFICNTLYQNVEDFLHTLTYTILANSELLTHFASIFVSEIVQEHWSINSSGTKHYTAELINDIIYIVKTYTFKNAYELQTFFIVYSASNKFSNILNKVSKYINY